MADKCIHQGKYTDVYQNTRKTNLHTIKFTQGHFLDPSQAAQELREEWMTILETPQIAIVIEVSAVDQPISMLAGIFFWAFEMAAAKDSTLAVCNPRPSMKKMFELCGVEKVIPVTQSIKDAQQLVLTGKPHTPKSQFWNIFKRKPN